MAQRPAISKGPDKAPKSDEFETFERGLRKVLSVPKKDLDEALKREKDARTNGNGSAS
jgi:hypothetical protein